ncbi:MAG: mercury(II) reductase [Nitrososphaerota archaeon]|nr:mercury(II) reductase [Nitrososphaerota archaeon]
MKPMDRYELIILGQGSAAFAAAIKANDSKVKTAMVGSNATEGTVIGGTCVNVGCMPSKRLLTVGTGLHNALSSPFKGITYTGTKVDFAKVMREKDAMVAKFRKEKYSDVLRDLDHVTYYSGRAKFVSRSEIEADGKRLGGERFIIAVGARTNIPPVNGIQDVGYLTNEDALSLKRVPKSLCVIGGRALGLEFAQMFAQFGAKVTILQRSERVLPEDEPEVSSALTDRLRETGIAIHTGVVVNDVAKRGTMKAIRFTSDGATKRVTCEHILLATGRSPNTEYLNLEKAGVKTDDRGFVVVNSQMQTSNPSVWAAGDAIGEPMLETIAAKEGALAVHNALSIDKRKIDFDEVPSAVFTYPEVARVGLTEAEAERRGIACSCTVLPMEFVPKAHVIGDTRGLVKMVIEREAKRIIGVHILAPHAADLILEGTLAVKYNLTIDDIIDTVHVFPTLSESIKLAAQSFYMDVGKMSCCVE